MLFRLFTGMSFGLIFMLILIIALPNQHTVSIYYYVDHAELKLTVLLFITFSLGLILGVVSQLLWLWKLMRENYRLKKHYQSVLQTIQHNRDVNLP
jgi:uncharacterized integral membrane protein